MVECVVPEARRIRPAHSYVSKSGHTRPGSRSNMWLRGQDNGKSRTIVSILWPTAKATINFPGRYAILLAMNQRIVMCV